MVNSYRLVLIDKTTHTWRVGREDARFGTDLMFASSGPIRFVETADGVLVNLAHVVKMVPSDG